jgi:hypothetical protein
MLPNTEEMVLVERNSQAPDFRPDCQVEKKHDSCPKARKTIIVKMSIAIAVFGCVFLPGFALV